ncbi:right-handed parallel beta-helix repeat-containing protein [bacterium]|nr:right-handed parallel beta-helix repeat-containing protein [bacterium]
MRKRVVVFIVLVLIILSGGLLFLFFNPIEKLSNPIGKIAKKIRLDALRTDRELNEVVKSLTLPEYHLLLSRKDVAHFMNLIAQYFTAGPQEGLRYYTENNKWRKAELVYQGKTYEIDIKCHGRQPTGHAKNDFYSYAIKLKKKEQINKTQRFSFIIRERLFQNQQLTLDVAKRMNVIYQPDELVKVKINQLDPKLHFFEYRLDDAYMESIRKASFRTFEYSVADDQPRVKSMIYTDDYDIRPPFDQDIFYANFQKAFAESDNVYTDDQKNSIYNRFLEFNLAIVDNKTDLIESFVDIDYMARFEATRMIARTIGHGFTQQNLRILYALADGKFYPAFTRDNIPSQWNKDYDDSLEGQINKWDNFHDKVYRPLPFFLYIAQSDTLRQAKYKVIYDFIVQQGESFAKEQQALVDWYATFHTEGETKLMFRELGIGKILYKDDFLDAVNKKQPAQNCEVLKNYIETSQLEICFHTENNKLLVSVLPQSMAALQIDEFKIHKGLQAVPVSLKTVVLLDGKLSECRSKEVMYNTQQDEFDAAPFFREDTFSTALDINSKKVSRMYVYMITFDKSLPASLEKNDVTISARNTVTGQPVSSIRLVPQVHGGIRDGILAASPSDTIDAFTEFQTQFPFLNVTKTENNELIVHKGTYTLEQDAYMPYGLKVIIEAGTKILLGENVALICYDGIDIRGTADAPVSITALDPAKPYGTFGVLGDESTASSICHASFSHGRERMANGVYFSGALSIHHNGNVIIKDTHVASSHADDGINIKYAESILLENCVFENNFADQVDLDYCTGNVINCRFLVDNDADFNGDGLDLSGSYIVASNNQFMHFKDKGMSVGEEAFLLAYSNTFTENNCGVAVKDLSNAYFFDNSFINNTLDINAFQKKGIFGGGLVYFLASQKEVSDIQYSLDEKSHVFFCSQEFAPDSIDAKTKELTAELLFGWLKELDFYQ